MVEIKLVRGQQTLLNQKYVDVSTNPHILKEIAPGIPGLEQNLVIPSYDSKLKSVFLKCTWGKSFHPKIHKNCLVDFIHFNFQRGNFCEFLGEGKHVL